MDLVGLNLYRRLHFCCWGKLRNKTNQFFSLFSVCCFENHHIIACALFCVFLYSLFLLSYALFYSLFVCLCLDCYFADIFEYSDEFMVVFKMEYFCSKVIWNALNIRRILRLPWAVHICWCLSVQACDCVKLLNIFPAFKIDFYKSIRELGSL